MNFETEEEFNLTEDVCDIEIRFCRFYFKIIKEYFGLADDFVCSANEVFNRGKKKGKIFKIPYQLLLLCIKDTCLGLRQFYNSLMNYEEIVRYLSKKNSIVIYCVVGESFLSALGICKVIDEAIEKYVFLNEKDTKQIRIIVTEKSTDWKRFCMYIAERLLSEKDSFYKNVEIKLEFFDEQPSRLSREDYKATKEADIVVMSRYLSRFQNLILKSYILEGILRRMKDFAILFYMDEHYKIYEKTMSDVLTKVGTMVEIKSKKTAFESLEDPRNDERCPEFPFLLNTGFEKVMYSVCIKCSTDSYDKAAEENEVFLLENSIKPKNRKIAGLYARELTLI